MNESIRATVSRLKDGLAEIYGERLKGVYIFGSYARGEADEESDLDVLIVLDRVDDYSSEIERTSALVSQLSLECGRSISRVLVSEERWREDQSMFFVNVRREAVAA
ncbi:MAG TPA: nucleotidyltransferase domain-containing protein [Bryobacteraceae bacterium]|nr:nucleotidyltransferase domain-containing protein [Bryobacteraceae bacterium]